MVDDDDAVVDGLLGSGKRVVRVIGTYVATVRVVAGVVVYVGRVVVYVGRVVEYLLLNLNIKGDTTRVVVIKGLAVVVVLLIGVV